MPSYDKQGNMIISREEQLEQQLAQARKPKNMLEQAGDVAATVGKYALGAAGLTAAAYGLSRPGVREKIGSVGQKAMDFFNEARSERPGGVNMVDLSGIRLTGESSQRPEASAIGSGPKVTAAPSQQADAQGPLGALSTTELMERSAAPKTAEAPGALVKTREAPPNATDFLMEQLAQKSMADPPGALAKVETQSAPTEPSRQQKVSDFLDTAKTQMADAQPVIEKAVETANRIAPAEDDTPIYEAAEYAKDMMDKGFGRSQSRRQVAGRMQEAAEDNINRTGESVLSAFLAEEGYTVDDQATQAMDVDGYQEVKPHRQAAQRQGADLARIDNAADTDLGTPNPRAADNDWENRGSMDPAENFDNPNPITDGETSTQPAKPKTVFGQMAKEARELSGALNAVDSKLARLTGQHIDDSAKGLSELRKTIDPGVKASDDDVMRKAMMVSPSKMAASAVEDNRPDNVDRMLAATKPENMETMGRMESNPNVFVKGKALVEGPGSPGTLYEGKQAYGDYIRDIHHNIDSELEEATGVPTADRPKSASAVRSAASREKREPIMYKGVLEGGSYNPSEAAARPVSPSQAMAEVANTPGATQGDIEQTAKQVGNALIEKTKKRRPGYYSQYGTSTSSMQ